MPLEGGTKPARSSLFLAADPVNAAPINSCFLMGPIEKLPAYLIPMLHREHPIF